MAGHPTPFVSAFKAPIAGSLRYNVAQYGSPIPLLWGTHRLSVNVLDLFGFKSTGSGSGKGGVTGSAKGKSGGKQYSVNVALGFCSGPVNIIATEAGWVNSSIQQIGNIPGNFYNGNDGQAPDPVFASSSTNTPVIGYSGTAYATFTPMQLGNAPTLPNLSLEIIGFRAGTAGPSFFIAQDANPRYILGDILNDPRIGIKFPSVPDLSDWGSYCQAAAFGLSLLMDKHQPASSWIEALGVLTVSAIFWSSGRLRVVPYAVTSVTDGDTTYTPNTTPVYNLTDDDFLPWSGGSQRSAGDKDPVLITRSDVSQLVNWIAIEYMERGDWYNPYTNPPVFDQGSIETYGVRTESIVQAHEVCNATVAFNLANAMLRRKLYLRNTYKFRVGWRHILLEPMDVVTLTDSVSGLVQTPVRIIEIQEDDQGALTMTAEDLV
jgi:hypothetical protein